MIHQLLQMHRLKYKKELQKSYQIEKKIHQNVYLNKAILSLHLDVNSNPPYRDSDEVNQSESERKNRSLPRTDRAAFNRKMTLIKSKKKQSWRYNNSPGSPKDQQTIKNPSHSFSRARIRLSLENGLLTRNYFCIESKNKNLLLKKKFTNILNTFNEVSPRGEKIHQLGNEFEAKNYFSEQHIRAKQQVEQSMCRIKKKMLQKKQKIKKEKQDSLLAESMDISPWKYGQTKIITEYRQF